MWSLFTLLFNLFNGGVSTYGAVDKFCEDGGWCVI